ncbi:MAG: phosphoglycerate kinase [Porticoccus sp.]|uniref:phosphoglycerate kinase n=1 Tax=Porticoccus sp. Uisw_050_02 TaxID=3230978 RepID=UPI001D4B8797|nr:phosphoglycerate kinase [Porticoccus sp.]
MNVVKMTDLCLKGKRVLIREDFNVPIKNGVISSDARIRAALPTIQCALESGANVILMSHLGRPTENKFDHQYSIQPVARHLSALLGMTVRVASDWTERLSCHDGEIVLLENVRFNQGEKTNSESLAKAYASICDIFVMDAFGAAHRSQASTHGVAKYAPVACAGPLLVRELKMLERVLENPARPMVAIVGGSKVSTKLAVLEKMSDKVDQLVVGGGIANTFLAAQGLPIGNSLCEHDFIADAQRIMLKTNVLLPTDVIVGQEFSEFATATLKATEEISNEDMILDIGPVSAKKLANMLKQAGTILWNGPVGVFEFDQFGEGTRAIAEAIADSKGFSIAGGGDTLAAADKYGIADKISYVSTGGGAFLEYVEGKVLPAVEILESRFKIQA